MSRRLIVCGALLVALAGAASAHFNVLLPEDYTLWQARKGAEVPCRFIWGHGYEHIWFNAVMPETLFVLAPDGSKTDLKDRLTPIRVQGAAGEVGAFRFTLKPDQRGDFILAMKAAPVWDEEASCWIQDWAKSVLHVQAKKGWDADAGLDFELAPLTRPYALAPGAVFRAVVRYRGQPLAGCEVELEKLQPRTPREDQLPGEEFMTLEAKTDANGVVAFGMTEPGWFGVTAARETGRTMEKDGHKGPVVERSTLWVHVAPLTTVRE